jgi:hypothetical protein
MPGPGALTSLFFHLSDILPDLYFLTGLMMTYSATFIFSLLADIYFLTGLLTWRPSATVDFAILDN